jgi:hypothetical protein
MEPNWPSTREDRARRAFRHAQHHLGVHLYPGRPVRAGYRILAVLSGSRLGAACPSAGRRARSWSLLLVRA